MSPSGYLYEEFVEVWAIVVGISQYPKLTRGLDYADRDATEFGRWLREQGGVAKDHLVLLINEQATTSSITWALRSFLQQPAREDLVIVYFACHGSPDPERPSNIYLLTHDTDEHDIAGTALPMREVELSLRENLSAERVVILADTCHSAALGDNRRDAAGPLAVNRFLQEISGSKPGTALLTSAEASETATEGPEWGGGHGVFTHFLLEGLRGAARQDGAATVKVGDLFDYVRDAVRKATGNHQHPSIGPYPFDRQMPIGIASDISLQQAADLGMCLYEMGRWLGDRSLLEAALRRLRTADEQEGGVRADRKFQMGQVFVGLGQLDDAAQRLHEAITIDPKCADSLFMLSMLRALGQDGDLVRDAMVQFPKRFASDPRAGLVRAMAALGADGEPSAAVLVAVDRYPKLAQSGYRTDPMQADCCKNDVRELASVLRSLGLKHQDVVVLEDAKATRANVLGALKDIASRHGSLATLLFHYSGLGLPGEAAGLILSDSGPELSRTEQLLSVAELADALSRVPASHRVVTIDGQTNAQVDALVAHELAVVLTAAEDGKPAPLLVDGSHGAFSHSLAAELRLPGRAASAVRSLGESVAARMRHWAPYSRPVVRGNPRNPFLVKMGTHRAVFELMHARQYSAIGPTLLDVLQQRALQDPQPPRELLEGLARAHLQRANTGKAAQVLKHWASSKTPMTAEGALQMLAAAALDSGSALRAKAVGLVRRHVLGPAARIGAAARLLAAMGHFDAVDELCGRLTEAHRSQDVELRVFSTLAPARPAEMSCDIAQAALGSELREMADTQPLKQLARFLATGRGLQRRWAILIGISNYAQVALQAPRYEAERMFSVLTQRFGFAPDDVTLLTDGDATKARILEALQSVAGKAGPADTFVLLFTGHVTHVTSGLQSAAEPDLYVPVDGLTDQISFERCLSSTELDALIRGIPAESKLVILDAGGPHMVTLAAQSGYTLLVSASPGQVTWDGVFTTLIVNELDQDDDRVATAAELLKRTSDRMKTASSGLGRSKGSYTDGAHKSGVAGGQIPQLIGNSAMPLFESTNPTPRAERAAAARVLWPTIADSRALAARLVRYELCASDQAIQILSQSIRARSEESRPEAYLHLGIALGLSGNFTPAVSALRKAIEQASDGGFAQAHLYMGRFLWEGELDLDLAVAELRIATQQDGSNAMAHFFLAQALRTQIERRSMVEARQAYRRYVEAGTPLGFDEDLEQLLADRGPGLNKRPGASAGGLHTVPHRQGRDPSPLISSHREPAAPVKPPAAVHGPRKRRSPRAPGP